MIRNKFFDDPDGGYAAISVQKIFNQVWKKVVAFELRTGQSLDNGYTKEQYIALFNSMRIRHTNSFPNCKAHVMNYVRYLIANGALPKEQEDILASVTVDDLIISKDGGTIQYYKNVNVLHDAIQDSIEESQSHDKAIYDIPAVILYLAWYGLTEEQIICFRRDDVLDDGIVINGEKVEIPRDILQVFKQLRDADGYYQQARGVIFHTYIDSEYLIRTERSGQISITKLQGIVSRLNNLKNKIYSLRYSVVWQSGIFYRAYLTECASAQFNLDDPDFASEIFCENLSDKAKRTARIRDYKLYKQLFY